MMTNIVGVLSRKGETSAMAVGPALLSEDEIAAVAGGIQVGPPRCVFPGPSQPPGGGGDPYIGKLLAQEAVVRKLVECRRQSEAARHLTWHAARLADLGQDGVDAALQARLLAVDAMVTAADEAIQIHGGYGYTVEYHVERHYRDGKTLEVLDGGASDLLNRLGARQFA